MYHDFRRPIHRKYNASTTGAHKSLKLKGHNTKLNKA